MSGNDARREPPLANDFDPGEYWERVNRSRRSPEYLREFYSKISSSERFDDAEQEDRADQLRFMSDVVRDNDLRSILDAGCGPGFWFQLWRDLGLDATAVDRAVSAVERARQFAGELGMSVETTQSELDDLPFGDHQFDAAFTVKVLLHTPPSAIEPTMRELARVARTLVLLELQFERPMTLREHVFQHDYHALATQIGLDVLHSEPHPRHQHFLVLRSP